MSFAGYKQFFIFSVQTASFLFFSRVLENIDLCNNSLGDEGKGVIRDAVSGREGFNLVENGRCLP